jgi:uncharacterized protein (DUF58 family)
MSVFDMSARRRRDSAAEPPSAPPTELIDKSAILRRLELDVRHRLDGVLVGDYLALFAGPGSERAGARPYEPGDDARRIDWNLTARAAVAHVRTTEADRELETWVVVDRSPSMDFGTTQREKREAALAALAAFGVISVRGGNRLGVLMTGIEELRRLPASNSRVAMMAALSNVFDTPRRQTASEDDANLATALQYVHRTHLRRGQVVVISDFLEQSGWHDGLRRLAMRHQVICVQISDPREFEIPPVGMLAVVDTESGRQMHVQTNNRRLRERYATAAAQRQATIEAAIVRAGSEHLHLSTDRDWLLDITRFVSRRRHRHYVRKDIP